MPATPPTAAQAASRLTPFPSPWIPSAREGLSAGKLPPTQPSVAERPSAPCTALRAAQVSLRAAPLGEDLKEAGGLRPPASFKTSPLPRLDSLLGRSHAPGEGSGVGVEDDHGRSACSRGAAVKLHVEVTSRS